MISVVNYILDILAANNIWRCHQVDWNGLTLLGEYHYSDFGVEDVEDVLIRFLDPDFQKRYLRGDTQILGRQAVAAQLSYVFSDVLSGGLLTLASTADGSGVLSPSLRWDVDRNITLLGNVFVPWGDEPAGGQFRSLYGATSTSVFIQAAIYH